MANGAANYTEELVMALVTTQLTIMSFPVFNVQIVPLSSNFENLFGADAKIPGSTKIAPFYMQFKRPNRSTPTGKISTDRTTLGMSCTTDSLNFQLRKKANPAIPARKLQHNVLHRMRERLIKRGIGDAAYVCSLFLSSAEYVNYTHAQGLYHWASYFTHGPYFNQNVVVHATQPIPFFNVPWLGGHVSIPPHEPVESARHSYSFDPMGGEICFHSPRVIDKEQRTLPQWIETLAERARSDASPTLSGSEDLLSELRKTAELPERSSPEPGIDQVRRNSPPDERDFTAEWFAFGDAVEDAYGISQFAMLIPP